MKDLFETNETQLSSTNNGLSLIKKGQFRKKAKIENRDLQFSLLCPELPKENEFFLYKSNGLSDTGSIFKHIVSFSKINTLYLSTWIISRPNIEFLVNSIESGEIAKIYFVVSTRLKQLKKSDYAFLIEQFRRFPKQIFFKVCNSHAKTFSCSDFNGNFYTVTGSGNWTSNPRIENYIFLNDMTAFDHNKEWMEKLING